MYMMLGTMSIPISPTEFSDTYISSVTDIEYDIKFAHFYRFSSSCLTRITYNLLNFFLLLTYVHMYIHACV